MESSLRKKRVSIVSISEKMRCPSNKPKARFGCRHMQAAIMCLCFLSCYAVRVTISVSLEAMTNKNVANPDFEEFKWDESTKQILRSSFFWGYICTQVPSSIAAQMWSAQKLFSLAMVICGLATIMIPMGAHYGGWEVVCAARVISGLAQGCVLPILHTLLSRWIPPLERGRFATFVYSGGWVGNVMCLLSSGYLSASSIGWPSCFYLWGGFCILCGVIFFFFGKDSPSEHPSIPFDEKEYIEISLGITEINETLTTPWISILKSIPVWALLITQCAQNWGFWMLLTEIPSYMTSIMHFEIQESGVATALPYLIAWIVSFPASYLSDLCIKRKIVSTQTSRKICNTLGQWIPAAALIGMGFVRSDQPTLAVVILILAVSTNILAYCGHNVNHMDLSPNFAGVLMGITNGIATICSLLAPLIAGVIMPNSSDIMQWRNIFFLSAGIYFVGNLAFILFGSSKVQKWNDSVIDGKEINIVNGVSKNPTTVSTIEELRDFERIP